MAIITIARECGTLNPDHEHEFSLGKYGLLLHKKMLDKEFRERGLDPKKLERYDERHPGIFASLFSGECDRFLHAMKGIILEAAAQGQCLVVGRGAHILLHELPNCLRVRFVAPLDVRVRRVMAWRDCDEPSARRLIQTSDRNRSGFCRFHFDSDWSDSANYDLVINMERTSLEEAIQLIEKMVASRQTPECEAASQRMIQDMLLCHRITEEVIIKRNLSIQFFEARMENGAIVLFGATSSGRVCREIGELAEAFPGVEKIDNRIQVVGTAMPRHLG